jgi:hypothetical protein
MISAMPEFKYGLVDVSFPNSKIFIRNIFDFRTNEHVLFLDNKPGLYHWVLVLVSNIDTIEFARLTEIKYEVVSYLRFCVYTIMAARDQKVLEKKIKYLGMYYRSQKNDSLLNLRWTSSKIRANEFGEIVSLTSPIRLFGRYGGYDILYVWASGFRNIIANGCLEIRLSFHCFSLGSLVV